MSLAIVVDIILVLLAIAVWLLGLSLIAEFTYTPRDPWRANFAMLIYSIITLGGIWWLL